MTLHVYIGDSLSDDAILPATVLPSLDRFAKIFSDRNRAMLRWIARNEPPSVYATAKALGYNYDVLCRTLLALEACGLVSMSGDPGKARPPMLLHRDLCLKVLLRVPPAAACLRLGVSSAEDETPAQDCDRVLSSITELSESIPGKNGLKLLRLIGQRVPFVVNDLRKHIGAAVSPGYPHELTQRYVAFGLVKYALPQKRQPVLCFDEVGLTLNF